MPAPIGPRPVTTPGVAPATGSPGRVDVGALPAAELARLRQTQPALARVVEQAKATYAEALARTPPASLVVFTTPANGGAPVLALAPPGFDASKPVTVHTHYHGDLTTVAAPGGSHTGHIKEQLAKDAQRLWVLPEAGGNVGGSGTNWTNVRDQAGTTREALAALGVTAADAKQVVSAHSAGGRALAAALTAGTLKADQLVLLDCLYESTSGPGAFSAILNAARAGAFGSVKDVVVVATGSYPAERNTRLREAGGPVVRFETLVPRPGLSNHEAAARNHLVPRGW